MAGATASPPLLSTAACGRDGLDGLAKAVRERSSVPSFAFLRVQLGSGSFAREKLLLIHINLDSIPGIKKAKVTSRKQDVRKLLGETHGEITVVDLAELDTEPFLAQLMKMMPADVGKTVNLKQMRADYEARVNIDLASPTKKARAKAKIDIKSGQGRKTAMELKEAVAANTVLNHVRQAMGPFNWALFNPSDKELSLLNAGSLSVPEMTRYLQEDGVCYGLVRLAFGTGRFRRVKYAFLAYCGSKAPITKRAKFQGAKGFIQGTLGSVSVDLQGNSPSDLSLAEVIAKVRKAAVVDGDASEESLNQLYSEDAFLSALAEEADQAGDFYDDKGDEEEGEGEPEGPPPVAEAVDSIRGGQEGSFNWALFTVHV